MRGRPRRSGSRWGLRRRVTVAFGLLALGVSILLSAVAWALVSQSFVRDAQAAAVAGTSVDAGRLDEALSEDQGGAVPPARAIDTMRRSSAAAAMTFLGQKWFATSPRLGPTTLPAPLVSAVGNGQVASQRVDIDGDLYLAVGMPLPGRPASFYELYNLRGTVDATRALSLGLGAATVLTVALGLLVGRWATTLALRPLVRLNAAAAEVASGRLGVRLEDGGDPDLVPLTTSFNRTVSDLDRRVVADARFAVDVSHELRTPLTTMLNSMQVIRNRQDSLPPRLREPVDLLADDLDRFRALVTDLLEVSRHDAGDDLVLEPVVVGDLVRRAADAAAGHPVTRVDDDARTVAMEGDKRRLERVVVNLVRNAEVHGGGCVGVIVSRTVDGVRVRVDDAGPGIPVDLRERVFERFSRGPGTSTEGVGLGLSIAARHVELHRGTIIACERPGGGASLVLDIPLERR